MRIEQVVVNASPLIVLLRSGQAELLPQLFSEIVIPEAVWQEVVMGAHLDFRALPVMESCLRIVIQKSGKPLENNLLFPSDTESGATSILSSSFDPKRKLNGASK